MKKTIALALVVLILCPNIFAFARASDYLDSYSIGISAQGGGVVKVTANVEGTHNKMTKIGFPTIVLYELNGSTWTPVKVVNSQYNPATLSGSYQYSFTYQGTAGKTYYAYSSFLAQDSTGSDSRSTDSLSIKAT